jgi:hypothetical protein
MMLTVLQHLMIRCVTQVFLALTDAKLAINLLLSS